MFDLYLILNQQKILLLWGFPKKVTDELLGLRQANAKSTLGRIYEMSPKFIFTGKWPFSWSETAHSVHYYDIYIFLLSFCALNIGTWMVFLFMKCMIIILYLKKSRGIKITVNDYKLFSCVLLTLEFSSHITHSTSLILKIKAMVRSVLWRLTWMQSLNANLKNCHK